MSCVRRWRGSWKDMLLGAVLLSQFPGCSYASNSEEIGGPPSRNHVSSISIGEPGSAPVQPPGLRTKRHTSSEEGRGQEQLADLQAENDANPEAFKIRAHTGDHAFYLAPFQDEALNDVFDASSTVWKGYAGQQEDGSINAEAGTNFQAAIAELRDGIVPSGGRLLDANVIPTLYSWNSPTTGGTTLSIFGLGFGWRRKEGNQCSLDCLANPSVNCPQADCFYVDAKIGDTQAQTVTWYSDSSLSMLLSPGSGEALDVTVIAGKDSAQANLQSFFTYDTPKESLVLLPNAPTSGAAEITIFGSNFGLTSTEVGVKVGETLCTSALWVSDSSLKCQNLRRGTGSQLTVQVAMGGAFDSSTARKSNGFPKSFSYDRPSLTHVTPNNGPPGGYSTLLTLYGKNFGMGPESQLICPTNRVDRQYILDVADEKAFFCSSGFPRFIIEQTFADPNGGDDISLDLLWDNIRPHSLAYDPISCVYNTYRCDVLEILSACAFIEDSCKPLSDIDVQQDGTGGRFVRSVCDELDQFLEKVACPDHWVSGYLKDGVSCNARGADSITPYFEAAGSNVPATADLCNKQPKYLGQCPSCSRLGCCNEPGTLGATVEGTECIALIWKSDSSMLCKAPPGIGPGRAVSVAIDDYQGEQVALLPNAFDYDGPVVTQITPRDPVPTSGGVVVTFQGTNFGTFQCNSSWCSFDASLLNCNRTHCDANKRLSKSISHSGSLKATYTGPDAFRTACTAAIWTSDSAVSCQVPSGTGDLRQVSLTVFRTVNKFSAELQTLLEDRSIAYEEPKVTAIEPSSLSSTGANNVTVYGRNFGNWDTQPLTRLAGTQCLETQWVSDTKVVCLAPRGITPPPCQVAGTRGPEGCRELVCNQCPDGGSDKICPHPYDTYQPTLSSQGVCRSMVVTVSALRGYITQAFSYQGGMITALSPSNGPPVGGFNVTILGQNFGDRAQYGYTSAIGGSDCQHVYWLSDSSIACSVSKGTSFDHTPRLQVQWNGEVILENILFSYNKPVIRELDPMEIPASGGVDVTISGENFGSHDEFADVNRALAPFPPTATVGDTLCAISQWTSDTTVICTMAAVGRGRGSGVGGNLPMDVEVGDLTGRYSLPFGYQIPDISKTGAKNGPALGGNMFFLTGNEFGVYDYSPTASIGSTDCRLTRWSSNTAVECIAPTCTTFLAGRNADLPIRVEVGLAHRLGSDQSGELVNAYTYDLPLEQSFSLNNVEINFLCFSAAAFLAGIIVCFLHVRYRKLWPTPAPSLPVRYSRTAPSEQHKIRPNPKLKVQTAEEMEFKAKAAQSKPEDGSDGNSSSSEESDFYEFEQTAQPDQMDEAFHRGMQAALGIGEEGEGEDSRKPFNPKDPYQTPLLGKDIVTGETMVYDPRRDGETGAGVGLVEAPIESVITPAPRHHKAQHDRV